MSVPAVVQDDRLDLLAANDLGRALFADLFDTAKQPPNFARYVFKVVNHPAVGAMDLA